MIRTISIAILVTLIAALTAGCAAPAQTPAAAAEPTPAAVDTDLDVDRITALYADWREAVQTADIPRYVAVLDPEVRLIPPGAEDIVGAGGYGAFLEPVFRDADYEIEVVQPPQVEVLGDYALARYVYTIEISLKNPDQGIQQPGALTAARNHMKYFDVLRRQDDGGWRVWRHTWNAAP